MAGNLSVVPRRRSAHGADPSTCISLLEEVRDPADAEAWRVFVDRYTPLVYGYCRQRGLQEADARDVTQNVFLAVSRAMRSFTYDRTRGRFRSWLGTITCREIRRYLSWVNRLRHAAGELHPAMAELDGELESHWDTEFAAYLFRRAAQQVRPAFADDVWRAFELTWMQDEAPADVARQLHRPVAWVYKAKFRVLKRLRSEVKVLADDLPLRPR